MTKYVLVTGGAGYIGSHACKALAESGYTPVAFDNLVYGHKWAVRWGPFVQGDLTDDQALSQVFKQYSPLAVIHFAAYAYVGESVTFPSRYYRNNVVGTIALLEAMRRGGCDKIIFSSSCSTYGMPGQMPIVETEPQSPINPYGRCKLIVEMILKDFDNAYGIKHFALRYFNAAGADSSSEIGELHVPETHLIPLAIQAALGQRPYLEVFGTDYPTPDGTALRDYIHVSDLAEAHVRAMEKLLSGSESASLNLGTGTGHSVRKVINVIEKVSGRPVPVRGNRPQAWGSVGTRGLLRYGPECTRLEMRVPEA